MTLLNDYVVLGSLGKGAYGSVKLCYSMQDDNLYALKVGGCTQTSGARAAVDWTGLGGGGGTGSGGGATMAMPLPVVHH